MAQIISATGFTETSLSASSPLYFRMYILDNVHKSYGHASILRNISCEIPVDGFVFIMGPSGSGKSTLLRLLSFVETPDEGVIRLQLAGQHFNSTTSDRPWPRVTCVFQSKFLWPHLTLRENVALPLRRSGDRDIDRRLERVIDLLDMSTFIDRFPNEVSGGQAQRVAIARALVLDPQVILIDEAHGGLDLEQQKVLNDHLTKLRESGVGLIVVTHSLDFARKYADKIIIVENGTITEIGSPAVFEHSRSTFLRRVLGLTPTLTQRMKC